MTHGKQATEKSGDEHANVTDAHGIVDAEGNRRALLQNRLTQTVIDFLGEVPGTSEHRSSKPRERAAAIVRSATRKAAITSGTLSLPPGPLGWLTVLPELLAIWRIQAQMVADIAAVYDGKSHLTREQMLYCMFRHTAAQAFRDIAMRVGERVVLRTASAATLQRIASRVGISLSRRAFAGGVARWLPLLGAASVGAYAWFDTGRVARTTIALFDVEIDDEGAVASTSTQVHARRVSQTPESTRRSTSSAKK